MLKDILKRIDQRLEAVQMKESAASALAGLSPDAIRNIRRAVKAGDERNGVSTKTLIALAPVLQTTASWLLEEGGPEEMPAMRLRESLIQASRVPEEIQARIIDFIEFEISNYSKRDTAA